MQFFYDLFLPRCQGTFFHKNSQYFLHKILLTIFSVKDLHFLLNKNSYHFSILNFYRKSFFKARMHWCAMANFGGIRPPFFVNITRF